MADMTNFIRHCDRLAEFEAFIAIIPQADHKTGSLKTHEKELTRLWETVRECYDSILNEGNTQKFQLELKQKYMGSYSTFVRGISLITDNLERIKENSAKASECPLIPNIHLPPCDTEIFYGDYVNWPTFRDMFSALYKNNSRLTPVEKLYYLLQKTKGEAHNIVRTCPLTNDGFELAWKNLVDRYENKRVIIHAQFKTLFYNIPQLTKETGPNLKNLQRTINDCITNLTLLNLTYETIWHHALVFLCSSKLPDNIVGLWEDSPKKDPMNPRWEEMDKFLTSRFHTLEAVSDIKGPDPKLVQPQNKVSNLPRKSSNESRKINSFATKSNSSSTTSRCILCHEQHPLRLCATFLGQNVDERMATVKRLKCCTNCLATSHEYKTCKSTNVCFLCKHKHHSLLHRDNQSSGPTFNTFVPQNTPNNTLSNNSRNFNIAMQNQPQMPRNPDDRPTTSAGSRSFQTYATHRESNPFSTVLLGTTQCEVMVNDIKCSARALIDPASQATFISKRLQKRLSIPTFSAPTAQITGLNGSLTATSSKVCFISVGSPIDPNFKILAEAYVVEKLTGQLPSFSFSNMINSNFPEITMTDVKFARMDLLLGGDIYSHILLPDVKKHPDGNLVAQKTVFGWIVTGKVFHSQPPSSVSSYFNHIELNSQLSRFWELEEVPEVARVSEADEFCEQVYQSTTYRNADGRYVVTLPFRREFLADRSLGNSRNTAMSQFMRNEARLLKTPEIKDQYDSVIDEYFELGHIKEVDPPSSDSTVYYLPHHAVFKPDSVTTKLRVVFNASSPSSSGVSLNNMLYPGPVLQADLTVLILRWRLYRYVFNADIEKMYRQILIKPEQTPFQRILFRKSTEDDVKDYELTTVTFGVNCAPYLAIRTLIQLADDCQAQSPAASEILKTQMYVDDVLSGSHELEDAYKRRNELMEVLGSAGFVLRKWTANHIRLLENLPCENLLDADFLKFSDASTTKTLGLRWNADSDSFYFKLVSQPSSKVVTKRAVLSEIAKLFDPAGWLSPKIIVAKMIMQQIWKDKTDWDEPLNPVTLNQWHVFLSDYQNIEKINIPRWVNFHPDYDIEIHGFCDASEKAYAATLYVRSTPSSSEVVTHLLASKTKVAPVKFETLPRLELCGATLMAKMVESLCSQLNLAKERIYLWTDSTIVLSWLKKPPCHWPTFVKNRVALILDKVGNENWSHVDSKDNPADLASRGSLASELIDNSLWWHGPKWLRQPKNNWPEKSFNYNTHLEIHSHHAEAKKPFDILERFSDLPRAMRVIAYCFRFLHYLRTHTALYDSQCITQPEMKMVKDRLIIVCQQVYIPEYTHLSKGLPLPPKSNLLALNPFIDSNGFVRINGRLARSPGLTYDERFPKILPYSARFTRLYVEHVHKCSLHGGHSLVLRLVRIEFWVPKLKNLIRSVISNCKECTIHRKNSGQQIMAALPPERSSLSRPFTHTGVDFAGPFEIKSYIGRGCRMTKGYVLVFVCFATKAIHLEATGDMSSDAFLAAFARFFSRRGCPSHLYSDNGTAFVGAANILGTDRKHFLEEIKKNVLARNSVQPVEWHFIPPGAPHMGGLWEAGVKSVKTHLKKIANAQKFTFEEFTTMLTRIEACLNSRPLSAMSDNPTELVPLTPGHFLVGMPLLAPPEPDYSDLSLSIANRWQKLKALHHQFALRWKEEYLKELHRRVKWKYPNRDFEVGDLVVIRQDNLPPNEWRLGRLEKVYRGDDSRVRAADVRTASGIFTRPIVKLVLLPNAENN